jgi:hypothetical protein
MPCRLVGFIKFMMKTLFFDKYLLPDNPGVL